MPYLTRRYFIKYLYILIDVLCMGLAIYWACHLRQTTVPFSVNFYSIFIDPLNPFRNIFLFWIAVTVSLNHAHNLYQTNRELFETVELWNVLRAAIISAFIIIVTIYVVKIEKFPRTVLLSVTFITALAFCSWRLFKRMFVEFIVSRGYNNFNILIVGAGKVGKSLLHEIKKKPALGLNVVGFIDDYKQIGQQEDGIPVLGKTADFVNLARREFIHKIIITSHLDENNFLDLIAQAKNLGVAVRVVPQGFELMSGQFHKFNIGFIPILEYCDGVISRRQVGKRIFDFITTVFAGILLIPVFILIAVIIKLDSPGPIFYLSRRYGRQGRVFHMIKFRSMVVDADRMINDIKEKNEVNGPIFKIRQDPRMTRVGRFLRKFSLDELPQFLNVLKGEMSLVGPRPLPIAQVEKEDLRQLRRLEVRPGITGLWQIRGRSDISFTRLVRWDVWYINNWSFWLDLNILYQTIPVVLRAKGAY